MSNAVRGVGTYLVSSASSFTAGTAGFLLEFFIMIYAMFFFLKDGRQILAKIFYYMPLAHDDEERILERFISISRATIKGTLLIGLLQGTLGGLGFFFAGLADRPSGASSWYPVGHSGRRCGTRLGTGGHLSLCSRSGPACDAPAHLVRHGREHH